MNTFTRRIRPVPASLTLAVSAALALAACGGGSDSAPGPGAPAVVSSNPNPGAGQPSTPGAGGGGAPTAANSVAQLKADMTSAHEATPAAFPAGAYWAAGPRLQAGNQAPATAIALGGFGQLYVASGSAVPANTRVELRNFETYVKQRSTGKWQRVQYSEKVRGQFFALDYSGTPVAASSLQATPEGYSAVVPQLGRVFRFWPENGLARSQISTYDVDGVFSTVQARLGLVNPAAADDRGTARFIVNTAADWWNQAIEPGSAGVRVQDNVQVGNGRLRLLGTNWSAINFSSAAVASIDASTPPLANSARTDATHAKRVLVIGDSISQGMVRNMPNYGDAQEHTSFRKPLWDSILGDAATPMVDFVGGRSGPAMGDMNCGGTAPEGGVPQFYDSDQDHEAYFGGCIEDVQKQLNLRLAQLKPDFALIHIGTNDRINQDQAPESAAAEVAAMIDSLRAANPNVKVLLSRIIPVLAGFAATSSKQIPAYNDALAAMAAQKSTPASTITMIDQYTGFGGADFLGDGIHPSVQGEQKIASRYGAVLLPALR